MILITGASGFIGGALARKLRVMGREILTPTHQELELTDWSQVKNYFAKHPEIDLVVHCAVSEPHTRDNDYHWGKKINNDIIMASNLLYAAPKMIVLTSGSVYGETCRDAQETYLTWNDPPKGMGWPKSMISRMLVDTGNLELRPFGVYGPGEQPFRFPSYCFKCIKDNEPIQIKNDRMISYIYIDDLVDIIIHYCNKGWTTRVLNVTDFRIQISDLANACILVSNRQVDLIISESSSGPYTASNRNLMYDMRTIDFTPLHTGLTRLWKEFCS